MICTTRVSHQSMKLFLKLIFGHLNEWLKNIWLDGSFTTSLADKLKSRAVDTRSLCRMKVIAHTEEPDFIEQIVPIQLSPVLQIQIFNFCAILNSKQSKSENIRAKHKKSSSKEIWRKSMFRINCKRNCDNDFKTIFVLQVWMLIRRRCPRYTVKTENKLKKFSWINLR